MEHALQQRKSLPEKLSQLLSGQQLSAAVALASAMGDVRLASLISQVTHLEPQFSGKCPSLALSTQQLVPTQDTPKTLRAFLMPRRQLQREMRERPLGGSCRRGWMRSF